MINVIDLEKQKQAIDFYNENRAIYKNQIHKTFDSYNFINGQQVLDLENQLSVYTGVKHAIGCGSGTDALVLALMALGIDKRHLVYTTPFTFVATAEAIRIVGATPVFVDIDDSLNIDVNLLRDKIKEDVNNAVGRKIPKAIIPVDIFGVPADYKEINQIAKEFEMFVVADCAQSFGATYNKQKSCSYGDIACTSFFPSKPLGSYGDGGMCFTNNDFLAESIRSIANHGCYKGNKYNPSKLGMNSRLDTIQAAILLEKLKILTKEIEKRQNNISFFKGLLQDKFVYQQITNDKRSAVASFSLICQNEAQKKYCIEVLSKNNIQTMQYYNKPLHRTAYYSNFAFDCYAKTDYISKRIFQIPCHAYLTDDELLKIGNTLI